VFLTRSHHPDWGQCLILTRERPGEGGPTYDAESFPATARKGRMGIRRIGTEIVLLAGDRGAEPTEIKRIAFTGEPIHQIRLYADTGGADLPLEGRFSEIVIRAESIDGAALPPKSAWPWTTYLLLASLGLCGLYVALFLRRRRRNRELYEE